MLFSVCFQSTPVLIVLYDSRALHSFISAAYVERHNILVAILKCRMIVSSTGGDMPIRQVCPKVKKKFKGGGGG
jgi:hypothetical protein